MSDLVKLSEKYGTDKNTLHCYIENIYQELFSSRKSTAKKVLEIGAHQGESIKLWRDYFENATVYSMDINHCPALVDQERINHIVANAYAQENVDSLSDDFDIIIEDGSHALNDMIFFLKNYTKKLNSNGVIVLEDIQSYDWIDLLIEATPEPYKSKIQVRDLRNVKGRYDDLAIVIELV